MAVPNDIDVAVSVLLWVVLALYLAGDLYWVYEMLVSGLAYREPPREYGPDDVQVRILTIDAEAVVRETVERLDPALADVHVIAERPMDVPGASVHVVPDSFACAATNKGRALEWARRTLATDREFVLFLDEDSVLEDFRGLPDADLVQFAEHPRYTGSFLAYVAEIYRLGYQYEQRSFPDLDIPLYAWGGGLAVRTDLEATVGWDVETIIEDTLFAWRAIVRHGADLAVLTDRIENQAPPSVPAMIRQRRRWIAGSREDHDVLPLEYTLMYGVRDLSWGVTGLVPLLPLIRFYPGLDVVFRDVYTLVSVGLFGFLLFWFVLGVHYYRPPRRLLLPAAVLAPLVTVLHSVGATWGLLSHPNEFAVTEKVALDDRPASALDRGPPSAGRAERPEVPVAESPGTPDPEE